MTVYNLSSCAFIGSMVGFLGDSAVNNTSLNLPVGGLQIPTATIPSVDTIGVPSECLMLKNMFDPKAEVAKLNLYFEFFSATLLFLSNDITCSMCCRRNRILIWILKKMLKQNALNLGS